MSNIAIKAVATSEGGFYYREEHEWREVGPTMAKWLDTKLQDLTEYINAVAARKEGGEISATFDMTMEGVDSTFAVTGITRVEMSKFQRRFHNVGDELIKIGEERASKKDHEHRQRHGKK